MFPCRGGDTLKALFVEKNLEPVVQHDADASRGAAAPYARSSDRRLVTSALHSAAAPRSGSCNAAAPAAELDYYLTPIETKSYMSNPFVKYTFVVRSLTMFSALS